MIAVGQSEFVTERNVGAPWSGATPSETARLRLLSLRGEPLFIADWERVLMMHFEVEEKELQGIVPFDVDLYEGRAFVTLVAFTMVGMRPRCGGRLAAWALKPIATHGFLNVRTYVRTRDEAGIYFMAEWLSNRLSVALGPRFFGLPYRLGRLDYEDDSSAELAAPVRSRRRRCMACFHFTSPWLRMSCSIFLNWDMA